MLPVALAAPLAAQTWRIVDKTDQMSGAHSSYAAMDVPPTEDGDRLTLMATCDEEKWTFAVTPFGSKIDFRGRVGSEMVGRVKLDDRPAEKWYSVIGGGNDYNPQFSISYLATTGVFVIRLELTLPDGDTPLMKIAFDDPTFKAFAHAHGCNPYGIEGVPEKTFVVTPDHLGRWRNVARSAPFPVGGYGLIWRQLPKDEKPAVILPIDRLQPTITLDGRSAAGWQHIRTNTGIKMYSRKGWVPPDTFSY